MEKERLIINSDNQYNGSHSRTTHEGRRPDLRTDRNRGRAPVHRRSFSIFSCVNFLDFLCLILGTICSTLIGLTPIAFYYLLGNLISDNGAKTIDKAELVNKIRVTSFYFLMLAALDSIVGFFQSFFFGIVSGRVSFKLRRELFYAVTRQDIHYFDTTETGTLLQMLGENCDKIKNVFSTKIGSVFVSIAQFFIGMGAAFYYSWQLTLVMLLTTPVLGAFIGFSGFTTSYTTKKNSEWSSKSLTVSQEVITGFRTVKSFSAEDRELNRFLKVRGGVLSLDYLSAILLGLSEGGVSFAIWGACAASFFVGGILIDRDELDLGKLFTVFGMALFGAAGVGMLGVALNDIFQAAACFKLIKEIILRVPAINFSGGDIPSSSRLVGEVEFKNVTFKYENRDVEVLKNVSFKASPGKVIALVGESGSGKSTVFSLIERFYDVIQGSVCIDGHNIKQLDPLWYHTRVALVSQEPILFSGTIEENIRYGVEDEVTFEEVVEAAKISNAHNFIEQLPDQYKTVVGERGTQMSGGQKQRIAIARAVLKNPEILLLDEATSALDTESERLVQDALDKLMVGRTSLMIAHRLSTVQNADTILVFEKGELVEEGTHEELLNNGGVYRVLASRQLMADDVKLKTKDI